MLFFYKSHTPIFSYTGHFKKIYNAVKCTIPTQILKKGVQWKKYLKNKKAIGETDNSKKRAVSFASFAGSLTVEAALILPIFLSAMLLLSGLFHAMSVCSQVNHYLCMTGRKIAAYSRVNDLSEVNVLRQCMMLISEVPMMAVYGYHAYNHYECEESMYIHRPSPELSTAENILMMLRPDKKYTELEARVLDVALMLHMEHGGGNNSTFTTHVVTSSGSDTYSVMAAALASLKGPKHGGANIKVMEMMDDLRANVSDTKDEEKIRNYLDQLVDKQAFDKKGLIYGMGHAVYSLSDPRAVVFKSFVESLAKEKGRMDDYHLYTTIERLAPEVIAEKRKIYKGVSANVDFYSGFVYSMLGIPVELYTPIFAMARVVGWSAHRMEELVNADKIIRPAYKSVAEKRIYQPIDKRQERELAGGNYRKIEEK